MIGERVAERLEPVLREHRIAGGDHVGGQRLGECDHLVVAPGTPCDLRLGGARLHEPRERRVQHRKAQVRMAVERLVWSEAEEDEAERLLADLDNLLDEESLSDGFTESPLEAHIARICRDLGLSPWPDGAAPAPGRSSA